MSSLHEILRYSKCGVGKIEIDCRATNNKTVFVETVVKANRLTETLQRLRYDIQRTKFSPTSEETKLCNTFPLIRLSDFPHIHEMINRSVNLSLTISMCVTPLFDPRLRSILPLGPYTFVSSTSHNYTPCYKPSLCSRFPSSAVFEGSTFCYLSSIPNLISHIDSDPPIAS